MRRAYAAAPRSCRSASSYKRTPSSYERRPPVAAFSSRALSDTDDLRNERRNFFDCPDRVKFATIRGETALRRGVKREIQFAVVNLVKSRRARLERLRERNDAVAIRAPPRVCIGKRMQARAHFIDSHVEDFAPRDPHRGDRLLPGPVAPQCAEIVHLLAGKLKCRIDCGIANHHRGFAGTRMRERIVDLD